MVCCGSVPGVAFHGSCPNPMRKLPAPPVFISGVRAGGGPYPISDIGERTLAGLTLQPDEAQIAIEFFGLDVAHGDRLRFEYRLDGAGPGLESADEPSAPSIMPVSRQAPIVFRFAR